MKSQPARLGVLLGGVAALLATMVPPASATTIKTVTFTGVAVLSACDGLSSFGVQTSTLPGTDRKPGPKPGTTVVNFTGNFGKTCNFTFASTPGGCLKTSEGVKAGKTGVDQCLIRAFGTVTGYCGMATGIGVVTIDNLGIPLTGPRKSSVVTSFKFTWDGSTWLITGGNAETNIVGEVEASPTTGSCTGTPVKATGFTMSGDLVYKDCTGNTVAGVCTQP